MKYVAAVCLLAASVFAQSQDGQPAESAACAVLKHKGDSGAAACYERLTRSTNPAVMAEGLWGASNFRGAKDAFRADAKAPRQDPPPQKRVYRLEPGYMPPT